MYLRYRVGFVTKGLPCMRLPVLRSCFPGACFKSTHRCLAPQAVTLCIYNPLLRLRLYRHRLSQVLSNLTDIACQCDAICPLDFRNLYKWLNICSWRVIKYNIHSSICILYQQFQPLNLFLQVF